MQNVIPNTFNKGSIVPKSFTSSDMTGSYYQCVHNLNTFDVICIVITDTGLVFTPDLVTSQCTLAMSVLDLSGLTISGTWNIKVIGNGNYTTVNEDIPFGICQTYIGLGSYPYKHNYTDINTSSTCYINPVDGDKVALYINGTWQVKPFTQMSFTNSLTSSANKYDVYLYWTGTAVSYELCNWNNSSMASLTRAVNLQAYNGILCKAGDPTRRYIGSVLMNGSNLFTDTGRSRFVWNYYNQVEKSTYAQTTGGAYSYETSAWRQSGGSFQTIYLFSGMPMLVKFDLEVSAKLIYFNVSSCGGTNTLGTNLYLSSSSGDTGLNTLKINNYGYMSYYPIENGTSGGATSYQIMRATYLC